MLRVEYKGEELFVFKNGLSLFRLKPGEESKLDKYKQLSHLSFGISHWEIPDGVLSLNTFPIGVKDWYGNEKRVTFFVVN